jgi:hypothetical protein
MVIVVSNFAQRKVEVRIFAQRKVLHVNQSTTHNIYNTSDLHDAQNFSMSNLQNPIFDANIGRAHFYVEQKK